MEDINNYSEFTEERYKALYDRIYSQQEKFISEWTENSRDREKGFEYSKIMFAAFLSLKVEEGLKEAIESFDSSYPLWLSMPSLMESIEPIRLKMLEKYYQSEVPQPLDIKIKTVERYRLFGFIPWLPKVKEVYDHGELIQRKFYKLDFSKAKLEALGNAKTKQEKDEIGMTLYSLERTEGVKPLEITGMSISGEPTRKRLFHAIVKYRAIHDYFNHLRVSDSSNYKKLTALYREAVEIDNQVVTEPEVTESQIPEETSALENIETSKKRQAIAYYYLLTAGGVKGLLSNKSEFARFIAFMSGYDLQADGKAKNIYNTSFYRIVKLLFGKKTTSFNTSDLDAVVQSFQKLDQGDNSLLAKAIEQLEKDKEA
ncbi:MAG: hypothetical protein KG003_07365 [Bacteroidetes bacterium]|nr:hypothetical protein [Bacteroidota bacterium]